MKMDNAEVVQILKRMAQACEEAPEAFGKPAPMLELQIRVIGIFLERLADDADCMMAMNTVCRNNNSGVCICEQSRVFQSKCWDGLTAIRDVFAVFLTTPAPPLPG